MRTALFSKLFEDWRQCESNKRTALIWEIVRFISTSSFISGKSLGRACTTCGMLTRVCFVMPYSFGCVMNCSPLNLSYKRAKTNTVHRCIWMKTVYFCFTYFGHIWISWRRYCNSRGDYWSSHQTICVGCLVTNSLVQSVDRKLCSWQRYIFLVLLVLQ